MKNIDIFLIDTTVIELDSTEMNEITGGNLWTDIKKAWQDVKTALREAIYDYVFSHI